MSEKKRSSLKKIIIATISIFIILSAGVIYYASTQISDEQIRKVLVEQIEKTFPRAQVELGDLSISAGFNFHIKMDSLKISYKDQEIESTLISLSNAVVSIPVWAILTGGGEVDVDITKPEIEYMVSGEESNWSLAMGQPVAKSVGEGSEGSKEEATSKAGGALAIPVFVTKSSLNLRIIDILFAYKTPDSTGQVTLSKFLIKNFNFETPTAFEVDSVLALKMGEEQINFSTLAIGEINFAQYISKKQLPLKAMIRTNKIRIPGLSSNLAEIKTDIELLLVESGEIQGSVKNNWDGIIADLEMNMNNGALRLYNIKFQSSPDQLLKLIDMKVPELNSGKGILSLGGEVAVAQKGEITPKLSFKLEPAITYSMTDMSAQILVNGKYEKTNLEVNLQTDVFSGVVTTKVVGEYDLNQKFDLTKLKPFQTTLTASNLKIPAKFIKEKIYGTPAKGSKAPPAGQDTDTAQEPKVAAAPLLIPPGRVRLNLNNIQFDDKELNGNGIILLKPDSIATESLSFNYVKGEGKLTHLTQIKESQMTHQFDFNLKDFDLSGIDPFLPAIVGGTRGIFNSSIKGSAVTYTDSNNLKYDVVMNVDAANGELLALDISEQLNQLIDRVPVLKDKIGNEKSFDFDGKFQTLSFRAKATDRKAEFNKLKFIGINNKIDITGEGTISPPPHTGPSEVTLNVVDRSGKVSKILMDNIGDNNLPIRLAGPGLELSPDYEYTVGRLTKTAFEKRGRQKVEQATEKAKDKLKEELKEKGAEKLKRLLGR